MAWWSFFEIKSFKQKEEEQRQYTAWAFPYGQAQQSKVQELILELMPDEKKTGLVVYLIGREAYQTADSEDPMVAACRAMSHQLPGRHRKKRYLFLALILADAQIDGNLQYPDGETIRLEAKKLEEIL